MNNKKTIATVASVAAVAGVMTILKKKDICPICIAKDYIGRVKQKLNEKPSE